MKKQQFFCFALLIQIRALNCYFFLVFNSNTGTQLLFLESRATFSRNLYLQNIQGKGI